MIALTIVLAVWIGFSFLATPIIGQFLTMRENTDDIRAANDQPAGNIQSTAH